MIQAPMAGGVVRLVHGFSPQPPAARTPSGMPEETVQLFLDFLFQTTNRPEVLTVSGICGCFLNFEKFCADVALSALSQYFWSRGPQFTPKKNRGGTVPFKR